MQALGQTKLIASPTAFEAFFYGSVLADALRHGATTRQAVQSYLAVNRPIDVQQYTVKFDETRVGFRYLALLRKGGAALRT